MIEIGNHLTKLGHEVHWYHPGGRPCPWMRSKFRYHDLKKILDRKDWDAVIFNRASRTMYMLYQQVKAPKKLFYILGLGEEDLDWYTPQLTGQVKIDPEIKTLEILRNVLTDGSIVMANSTWQAEYIRSIGFECHAIVGAINHNMFKPVDLERPRRIAVGYSGDPRDRKGTFFVEAAMREIKKLHGKKITKRKYYGLNLPQKDMAAWYSQNHIFLDGQFWAGWNNPLSESIVCGVPVVGTQIGGNADIIESRVHGGILVPKRDPEAMAAAAIELLDDEDLYRRLRESGMEHMKQYSWAKLAKEIENLIAN